MPNAKVGSRIALGNILYLTDFSEASKAALPFAIGLARGYGAKLHAVHILLPDSYAVTTPDLAAEVEEGQKQFARAEMHKLGSKLQDVKHETRVEAGNVFWIGLEHEIRRHHIDLIVVGTHGRTGVRKMLLGSVAEEVFRGCNIPVVTIGPGSGECVSDAARFGCVLFATDFTPASEEAAPYAISLAEGNESRLILLHVISRLRKEEMLGQLSIADAMHQLNGMVPRDAPLGCRPDPVVAYGDAAEKIVEIACERAADLIVLGIRHAGHGALAAHLRETTAHRVVATARCPVLTVRGS